MLRLHALLTIGFAVMSPLNAQGTPARDTLDSPTYEGWKQYSLQCARCHGDDGLGSSFGPNLLVSLRPGGTTETRNAFKALLVAGRPAKGMPAAATLGVGPEHFDGLYAYLSGRSAGRFHGGRPVRQGG